MARLLAWRYMLAKVLTAILACGVLSSCLHTPSYYSFLDEVIYAKADTRFSYNTLSDRAWLER